VAGDGIGQQAAIKRVPVRDAESLIQASTPLRPALASSRARIAYVEDAQATVELVRESLAAVEELGWPEVD